MQDFLSSVFIFVEVFINYDYEASKRNPLFNAGCMPVYGLQQRR